MASNEVDEKDLKSYLEQIIELLEFMKNTLIDIEELQRESFDTLQELESVMREIDLS